MDLVHLTYPEQCPPDLGQVRLEYFHYLFAAVAVVVSVLATPKQLLPQ